jgi:hypothetical protein
VVVVVQAVVLGSANLAAAQVVARTRANLASSPARPAQPPAGPAQPPARQARKFLALGEVPGTRERLLLP